jgi:hypothetical protein
MSPWPLPDNCISVVVLGVLPQNSYLGLWSIKYSIGWYGSLSAPSFTRIWTSQNIYFLCKPSETGVWINTFTLTEPEQLSWYTDYMGWIIEGSGFDSRKSKRFVSSPKRPGHSRGLSNLLDNGCPRQRGRNVKLNTRLHLVQRLGTVELYHHCCIQLHGLMLNSFKLRDNLTFYLYVEICISFRQFYEVTSRQIDRVLMPLIHGLQVCYVLKRSISQSSESVPNPKKKGRKDKCHFPYYET